MLQPPPVCCIVLAVCWKCCLPHQRLVREAHTQESNTEEKEGEDKDAEDKDIEEEETPKDDSQTHCESPLMEEEEEEEEREDEKEDSDEDAEQENKEENEEEEENIENEEGEEEDEEEEEEEEEEDSNYPVPQVLYIRASHFHRSERGTRLGLPVLHSLLTLLLTFTVDLYCCFHLTD